MLETLILLALFWTTLFVGIIIGIVSSYRTIEAENNKKTTTLFTSEK